MGNIRPMTEPSRPNAILTAATEVIAEHGVRGLRVEEVAKRSGVGVSLLYYYFDSRAGLLEATLDFVSDRAVGSIRRTADGEHLAFETLQRALLDEIGSTEADRKHCVVWSELTASAVFDPALREKVAKSSEQWTQAIADLIRAGQADGSVHSQLDVREEADLVTSLVEGVIVRWLTGSITRPGARRLLTDFVTTRFAATADHSG